MTTPLMTQVRERLMEADRHGHSASDVCAEIASIFHELALFDCCALLTVDPDTMLPSGGIVEGFAPELCGPFWDSELRDPDFGKFSDLARSIDPVATLFDAVDGDLFRSPRYQKLYAQLDAADELRAVFVAGSTCLAVGAFLRPAGAGPFTPEEVEAVRAAVPLATSALRRAMGRMVHEAADHPPVVIVLDEDDQVIHMTTGGQDVLDDLRTQEVDESPLPGLVRVAARKARSSRQPGSLTTRMRGQSGQWRRLHVSPTDGPSGVVVITVETARSDDLVPILLDSYGLTERETEVVLLLCRGLSAREIAAELIISPHTVRDYAKTIYGKAQVSSRGELVARLFSSHFLQRLDTTIARVA